MMEDKFAIFRTDKSIEYVLSLEATHWMIFFYFIENLDF